MRFLVAVDGSDASNRALEHATTLAARLEASLLVVNAVEPDVVVTGGAEPAESFDDAAGHIVSEALEDAEADGERVLDEAVTYVADAGVTVQRELVYGDPVDAIPTVADREAVDGIFVGHRGLSKRYEGLVGSVAKGLVERSTVPVTVVR